MARTMGRGGVQSGGRGSGRSSGRGVQSGGQGSRQSSGRGSSQCSGLRSIRGIGQGSGHIGDRGVGQHGDRDGGQASDGCNGQRSGHIGDGGSGIGSCDNIESQSDADQDPLMPSPIDGSDDESTVHVARRGRASQVQVPEPINRDWIWIEDGQFSNQTTSTRIIGLNLKNMWLDAWDSWRDVSYEHRMKLFERFMCYFQWEEKWNAEILRYWEKCIAGKFPDLLNRVRVEATTVARIQGIEVGDDFTLLDDFKPSWIRYETWKKMLAIWNTPEWKEKSKRNSAIRNNSIGGKHTLGAQTYVTAKRKGEKTLGRELKPHEMWKQSHCRKGSRPLDKDLSSLLVSDNDSEGSVQGENLNWVDNRAKETWVNYNGYVVEKYGDDRSIRPKFDKGLWTRAAGGMKKGKVYGLSNVSGPRVHGRQDPEIEKLHLVIKELVKEKEEDKERLNGVIKELTAEKEKDKAEKDAILSRMTSIEVLLKSMVR